MLKVVIVDDEPYIAMGLGKIIPWNDEGFEVVHTAMNGKDALNYINENPVDVVITDIQMPEMNGLELLEAVSREKPDIKFVVLSGYSDFSYVQTALRLHCMDYLLKPIQKEELLSILRKISQENQELQGDLDKKEKMQAVYIEHNLKSILSGKADQSVIEEVLEEHPLLEKASKLRYIHLCPIDIVNLEELDEAEIKERLNNLYEKCRELLKDDADLCVMDYAKEEGDYTVGFIFHEDHHLKKDETENDFYEMLLGEIQPCVSSPLVLLAGKQVDSLERISRSYSSACMLRSFQGFASDKEIYIYEEEMLNNGVDGVVLCAESLDKLVSAVALNDKAKIQENVDLLFDEMERVGFVQQSISINMNYLLFRLIYLAVEQDESVNQEEVMRYIGASTFERGIARGSRVHLLKFANEYAEYIIQLRSKVSRGVLSDIEREIKENYSQNLTLRELSQKYFVNSSYLGQIFRKKYGVSFKDYLCEYRIDKAAHNLITTDKKIAMIAEEVGYKDLDYFITKFIEKKGMAPAKYRRQMSQIEE